MPALFSRRPPCSLPPAPLLAHVWQNPNLGGTTYDLKGMNGSLCGEEALGVGLCKDPGWRTDARQ